MIFNPTTTNTLACLQNSQGHIITKPDEIAREIYHTQKLSFQRQAPLCDDITDHSNTCLYAIRKYPWHTQQRIILEKKGFPTIQICNHFTRKVYDCCIK